MTRFMSVVVMLAIVPALIAQQPEAEEKTEMDEKKIEQPATALGGHVYVKLDTTMGAIVLDLDAERAPISVENFLAYVDSGYYNGTVFHRVIPTFMIQGGGFTTDMDKKTEGLRPAIKNEWQNGLKNDRGTISMARMGGNADSATSQFFINVVDNGKLDKPQPDGAAYAVFGKVVAGMEVVDKIRSAKVIKHPKYPSREGAVTPDPAVVINTALRISDEDAKAAVKLAMLAAAKADVERKSTEEAAEQERVAELAAYITKIEAETGKKVQKTDSGLMYLVLTAVEGDAPKPKATDTVEVHYVGTFFDGKEFDSSVKRGKPATFPLKGVIRGWTEGVAMMKVGEKWKLICPPYLAYGARGRPGIPANSTLVFDVELLSIKGAPERPAPQAP